MSIRYARVAGQCVVVIVLSITAILAGLIARYSTRPATVIHRQSLPGLLPYRYNHDMYSANVQWNFTHSRLNEAKFPFDQLLDYLPNIDLDWVYDATQWNNSWKVDYSTTPQTSIAALESTGLCSSFEEELPALASLYSPENYHTLAQTWGGHREGSLWRDLIISIVGFNETNYDEPQLTYKQMDLMITIAYFRNVPLNENASSSCQFGVGSFQESSYTQAVCHVKRQDIAEDYKHLAYPDLPDSGALLLADAVIAYYGARLTQESASYQPISIVGPDELIRF